VGCQGLSDRVTQTGLPRLRHANRRFDDIYYLCNMKAKKTITEKDYINGVKKANRELEIAMFGKQVSMRGAISHKSKKDYNRQQAKRIEW
jgi:hypothetical protein